MTETVVRRREAAKRRVKAMGNPVRHEIFKRIRDKGGASPAQVARDLGLDINTTAYHVRELAKIDYVVLIGEAPVRGAVEHFYRATEQALVDTEEWDDLTEGQKEGLLIEFMQPQVDDFTAGVRSGTLGRDGDWVLTRTPVHATDRQGFKEMRDAHEDLRRRITEIQAQSLERLDESGEDSICVSSALMCFEVPGF